MIPVFHAPTLVPDKLAMEQAMMKGRMKSRDTSSQKGVRIATMLWWLALLLSLAALFGLHSILR